MSATRHLLTVWNLVYAESAMNAHLEVLLSGAEGRDGAQASQDEEPPYGWWARLKSPNRQQPLPHGAQVLAPQAQIEEGTEVHLYLTDYRSLYVAHINEVTDEDVLSETPGEAEHWKHIRTTNPIESAFATVRLRQQVTRGAGSRVRGVSLAYKLLTMAEGHWRKLDGAMLLPLVRADVPFTAGLMLERADTEGKEAA
jgi:hypothetical protein